LGQPEVRVRVRANPRVNPSPTIRKRGHGPHRAADTAAPTTTDTGNTVPSAKPQTKNWSSI